MIKNVDPLLKECEETLAELKALGKIEIACYVQGFINSIKKLPEIIDKEKTETNDRDCANCKHYKHYKEDIFACESWECKYEPRDKED